VIPLRKLPSYFLLLAFIFAGCTTTLAQKPIDPCFESVKKLGFYGFSEYVRNMSTFFDYYIGSDMMQWNGSEWDGRHFLNDVDLAPPIGPCDSVRALWLGSRNWTSGGEGFGLKLDKSLEAGKTYTFTFTYASDGVHGDGNFAPRFLTAGPAAPLLSDGYYVTDMPPAGFDWETDGITFKATTEQHGHNWIILHAYESSGIVLSDCIVHDDLKVTADSVNSSVCEGESILLEAPEGLNYQYQWSTGETTRTITAEKSGDYSVSITNFRCENEAKTTTLNFVNCDPHLTMPNVFTPDGDSKNPVFKPIYYDNIASAEIVIYNRWGQKMIATDLQGWNGNVGNEEAPAGVYYYELRYKDFRGIGYQTKGSVRLIR
jgi:gliding motility-associated-like protein